MRQRPVALTHGHVCDVAADEHRQDYRRAVQLRDTRARATEFVDQARSSDEAPCDLGDSSTQPYCCLLVARDRSLFEQRRHQVGHRTLGRAKAARELGDREPVWVRRQLGQNSSGAVDGG